MAHHSTSGNVRTGYRLFLFAYFGGTCQMCLSPVLLDVSSSNPARAEVLHCLSDALGGRYTPDNVTLGCRTCNENCNDDMRSVWASVGVITPDSLPRPTDAVRLASNARSNTMDDRNARLAAWNARRTA